MKPVDRRSRIQLSLAEPGQVCPQEFRIYAAGECRWQGAQVQAYVIGASSIVVVRAGERELTELVTCGPHPSLPRSIQVEPRPGAEADLSAAWRDHTYRARLWVTALGQSPFPDELPYTLEHRFPGAGNPATRIEAGESGGCLQVRTRHDYPELDAAVWSESEWSLWRA